MNFIEKLFKKDLVKCPRCLGKGHVDLEDIKRLNKELKWLPGSCAYCNGKGEVKSKLLTKVPFDMTYLSIDLPKRERNRIINKDSGAFFRANMHDERVDIFIKQIEYLNSKGNLSTEKIVDFFLIGEDISKERKEEFLDYVSKVVAQKSNF